MVKNRKLSQSISDAGWSKFRMWLDYLGKVYGTKVVAVPPHNTSQNCSNCGKKVSKSLSTRTHVCSHCGYVADRDTNAAINILKRAQNTAGHAEINAWGETPSSSVGATLLGYGDSAQPCNPRAFKPGECQLNSIETALLPATVKVTLPPLRSKLPIARSIALELNSRTVPLPVVIKSEISALTV